MQQELLLLPLSRATDHTKRWKRIDLLHGMLGVAETYSDGEFGPPKTRSSRGTIPISSSLIEIFKRLRPFSCDPETLVFATAKGTPLNCKNLYNRELAPASDAIGLPRASWHRKRRAGADCFPEGFFGRDAQIAREETQLETCFVERQNLTMRMQMRHFTRLTNAFSKKIATHSHAIVLHFMHYNFCRVHQTARYACDGSGGS